MSELFRVFHKGLSGTRTMYPANESFLDTTTEIINKAPAADYYESIYLYRKEQFEILKETKTLAGIRDVKTDRIVLDFDSTDVAEAKNDAVVALERLNDLVPNHKESVRIFASGNKGFHIEVHLNSCIDRSEFESIIYGVAGDLTTFDEKVKDQQRLFRFPLTRNQKTKRFKIPLTQEQLVNLSVSEIESLSSKQDHTEFYDLLNSYVTVDLPPAMKNLKNRKKEIVKKEVTVVQGDGPDMSRKPKHLTAAKYVLQEGYFEEGERNEACVILASTYKFLGFSQDHAYNMIKATLRLRSHRLGIEDYDKEELWRTVIVPVYGPMWQGGTFSEEEGLLARTIMRYDLAKVSTNETALVSLSSIADHFRDFAVNIDKNTIRLGIKEIDEKVRVTTSMLVCLLAAPGAGKTSISLGILNTLNSNNERAIFFSLDMGMPQVFQRIIQRHTGDKADTILDNYKNGNEEKVSEYEATLEKEYNNVKFCFKSGITTDHIRSVIINQIDSTGIVPKLVVIDYLECIQGPFSDSNANKALIATQLKDIANEFGICVFLLVQPAKQSGDPSQELTSYTQIKGSSVLGEASSVVFTMFRPGFSPKSPQDDKYLTINVVKNRMGELSSTDLGWTGLTGNLHTLDTQQKRDLADLRARIAQQSEGGDADEIYASKTSGSNYKKRSVTGGDLY